MECSTTFLSSETVCVSDVQEVLQPEECAPDPYEEAHRRAAPRLPPLPVRLLAKGKLENSHFEESQHGDELQNN